MEEIIIPLDGFNSLAELMQVVKNVQKAETLAGEKLIWGFKVNDALIEYGTNIIRRIYNEGFRVMADPKLYDIPNTINNSLNKIVCAGADIVTVHASADYVPENITPTVRQKDYIAGVTVLTSMSKDVCRKAYGKTTELAILDFYNRVILPYGYKYMVCSVKDLSFLPDGNVLKICPGIRFGEKIINDDQVRKSTPSEAIKSGADLIVIGRPILNSKNPIDTIKRINEEISNVK